MVENPALAEARDEAKGVADTVLEATDDLDADELDDNFEALACKVADAIHEWAGLAEAARKMVPPGKPGRPNSGEDEDDEEEEEEDEEEEDDEEECDEDVAEAMRRAAGSGKMVKTQKMTAGEKADAKKYYKQNKGKIAKQAAKRAKSASGQKLAKIAAKFTKEEESISDPVVALEAAVNDYPGTFEGLTAERAAVMFEHAATAAKEFEKNAEGSAASLLRIVGGQATALKESLVGTDVVSNTKYFDSMFESIVTALVGHGEDVAAGAESDDEEETVSYTESDFDLFHFSREEIAEGMKKFGSDYRIQMIRGVVEGND